MHPNDPDNIWPPGEEDAEREADMDARNEAHAESDAAAFTPGPWSVMWQNSRARDYAGGWKSWETPVQVGRRANAGNVLCTVTMGGTGAGQSDQATVEANARLIAAAPDGYAAAKDALAGWRYIREHHGDLYGVGWDRVEKALADFIAKAEDRS